MTPQEEARALVADGASITEAAVLLGRSTSTVWQWVNDPTGEKDRERKRRYCGVCVGCGAPTCGHNGRTKAPTRCVKCTQQTRRVWTEERIIRAICDWVATHGQPPSAANWNPAMARRDGNPDAGREFSEQPGRYPSVTIVRRRFGSWSAAIRMAGYSPNPTGRPKVARS